LPDKPVWCRRIPDYALRDPWPAMTGVKRPDALRGVMPRDRKVKMRYWLACGWASCGRAHGSAAANDRDGLIGVDKAAQD